MCSLGLIQSKQIAMSDNALPNENKVPRPLGVWILTIYAAITPGIVAVVVSANQIGKDTLDPLQLGFNLFMGLAILISAGGAFLGRDKARISFLVFLVSYYAVIGINNLTILIFGQPAPDVAARAAGRLVRSAIISLIYLWYFRRPATLAFYRAGSSNNDHPTSGGTHAGG